MKKKYIVFLYVILFLAARAGAQIRIDFAPTYAAAPLNLEAYYKYGEKDSVQVTDLQFYVSQIKLYKRGFLVFSDTSAHLIAYGDSSRQAIVLNAPPKTRFDELHFSLGIDSVTNVAGAMGGDLDPTLGMYWAWQSGYINFKLEGNSNLCATRKNEYKYHLGGYLPTFLAVQNLKFKIKNKAKKQEFVLGFDLEKALTIIGLAQKSQIMSPSLEAVEIAQKIAQNFTLRAKK